MFILVGPVQNTYSWFSFGFWRTELCIIFAFDAVGFPTSGQLAVVNVKFKETKLQREAALSACTNSHVICSCILKHQYIRYEILLPFCCKMVFLYEDRRVQILLLC